MHRIQQLKVLRAILNFAVEREYLDRAPIIRLPKDKRSDPGSAKPVRYFTVEERARLLAWCGKNQALADFIRVDLLTGMRPDEIFHLRCRSVDFARNRIRVEEQVCPRCKADNNPGVWVPKVGVWRELEMNDQLRPLMKRLCEGRPPDALVFENRHGAPFEQAFYKLLQRAGLARSGLSDVLAAAHVRRRPRDEGILSRAHRGAPRPA
jgi:integrase